MSTQRDTRDALSDITNIAGMISHCIYITLGGVLLISYTCPNPHYIDEARREREERNLQQRIRRAEMSDEQREEMRRKQREYQRQYPRKEEGRIPKQ
jgi:hypothetical protein